MKIVDAGVKPESFMDFTIPSAFARSALYCVPQFGHFHCTAEYRIERQSLELFLLMYVCAGTLYVETGGERFAAQAGQIVLLDCRRPHVYYCLDDAEFLWFHFQGAGSEAYADYLLERSNGLFDSEEAAVLRRSFETVLTGAQQLLQGEHAVSVEVHRILSRLAAPVLHPADDGLFEPALRCIHQRFREPIAVEELAALCSMSTSHFIRSFKKHFGSTPHEYLLAFRIRQAKLLLLSTALSVEEIADQCGFHSASHFARAFRAGTGMRPTEFRTMQF